MKVPCRITCVTASLILASALLPFRARAQRRADPISIGVERWPVKTGTDPQAPNIRVDSPTAATVAQLGAIRRPSAFGPDARKMIRSLQARRVTPVETTAYAIPGTIIAFKLEKDGDYHIVVADTQVIANQLEDLVLMHRSPERWRGHTMVVEIPRPDFVDKASPWRQRISLARRRFNAQFGRQEQNVADVDFIPVKQPVSLVGIGMFDFDHGQTGSPECPGTAPDHRDRVSVEDPRLTGWIVRKAPWQGAGA